MVVASICPSLMGAALNLGTTPPNIKYQNRLIDGWRDTNYGVSVNYSLVTPSKFASLASASSLVSLTMPS